MGFGIAPEWEAVHSSQMTYMQSMTSFVLFYVNVIENIRFLQLEAKAVPWNMSQVDRRLLIPSRR